MSDGAKQDFAMCAWKCAAYMCVCEWGAGVTPPTRVRTNSPSGSRTRDSGAGGGHSNKERQRLQPLASVATAPLFEVRGVRFTHSPYWHTSVTLVWWDNQGKWVIGDSCVIGAMVDGKCSPWVMCSCSARDVVSGRDLKNRIRGRAPPPKSGFQTLHTYNNPGGRWSGGGIGGGDREPGPCGADETGAHQGGADETGAHQGGADETGAHQGGADKTGIWCVYWARNETSLWTEIHRTTVHEMTAHRTSEHTPQWTGLPGEDVGVGLSNPWLGWVAEIKPLDLRWRSLL